MLQPAGAQSCSAAHRVIVCMSPRHCLLLLHISVALYSKWLFHVHVVSAWIWSEPAFTFSCPGSERAAVVDDVVEGEGDDEEGAVAGRVHLERHISLVQPHRLPLLCQGRLEQLPRHLGAKMQWVNVAMRLQKASCNQKPSRLIPATATEVGKGVLKQGTDVSFNLFITGSAYQLNDRKGFFYKQTEVTHNTNTHPENKQTVVTGRPSDITKEDSNMIKLLISIYASNEALFFLFF